ncbi:MAG: Fic family protein [Dysgonamonadaceae bacterium]|jgi:fido (protein-threonine AMPylation protein)|nr:Fic family protein [Dysgonamonadaceae bacterium]
MNNFEEYIRQNEPQKREKGYAWQTAIGLQAVDGLKPSDYLIETARKHIEGDITIDEVRELIKSYYESKENRTADADDTEEADKVSVNIARLLNERTFAFTIAGFTAVHKRIFDGVFKFAGKIRDYNITKKEWALRGDTVLYVSAPDIRRAIEYDLEQERAFDYIGLSTAQMLAHITKFVSGLWQIHPFGEGNTRTTAVFTIQYLRSMGFDVENDLFANHSRYFRNALVRANYQNVQKGIKRNPEYLERFFRNLLMGEKNELKNRYLLIQYPEELQEIENPTENRTSTEQPTEQVRLLLSVMGREPLALKQLMEKVGLKHRPTFLTNYINPAMKDGFVRVLYPEKPNHPHQKYSLTVKGMALYDLLHS